MRRGASEPATLLTFPSGADCCHKGGRLAFGPDGKLYVTLGEEHAVTASSVGDRARPPGPSDVRGKILRYNPDGTIPADNPFGASTAAWATGFRNVFGLAFGPDRHSSSSPANGPTGDIGAPSHGYDLAFMVEPGGRYQWPACYGYGHPRPGRHVVPRPAGARLEQRVRHASCPPARPGSTRPARAGLAGHFVFCNAFAGHADLRARHAPHGVLEGPRQCLFDVKQGPDHALYFSDEGAIYRLAPGG